MIDKFDGTKYRFLSNFYMAEIEYEGIKYPSSEHAYQAAKSTDLEVRKRIATCCKTPNESKKAGRIVRLRANWDLLKRGIMLDIVRIKFKTHADLRQKLLETGDEELVEGNTWGDVFFGVCNGVGENHLGKILMQVREELRKEDFDVRSNGNQKTT